MNLRGDLRCPENPRNHVLTTAAPALLKADTARSTNEQRTSVMNATTDSPKRNDATERNGSVSANSTHSRTRSVSSALTTGSTFPLKRYITSSLCRKVVRMMQRTSSLCASRAMQGFTHSVATVGTDAGKVTLRKTSRTALTPAVTSYKAR